VGIVLGATIERHNRFRRIAAHHQAEFEKLVRRLPPEILYGDCSDDPIMRRLEWHGQTPLILEGAITARIIIGFRTRPRRNLFVTRELSEISLSVVRFSGRDR
jgi:hypothetical protein